MTEPELWPHQARTLDRIDAAIGAGRRRILVTIPTGGGKTRIHQVLAGRYVQMQEGVVLYTNRTMLREQLSDVFMDAGIYHGQRAAGEEDEREHLLQISSIQTEYNRVVKEKRWDVHDAGLALVDEAHMHKETMAVEILGRHTTAGAVIVGMTATPLDLGEMYEHLIVGATNAELRDCGAIVPAHHFAPDEPDLRSLKKIEPTRDEDDVELTEKDRKTAMGPRPQLWGRVWDNYELLNPEHLPTLLFAAGVEESIWFAQQFTAKGQRAAHIDGDDIWIDGELHRSDGDLRRQIVAESKAGSISVVCNRFVMREGIDCPWLRHGIFATVFGSVQTYLQAGGRLLRASPGKEHVTIQDHGGNWWKFGSLNDNRKWFLDQTGEMAAGMRADRIRKGDQAHPYRCPKCARTWTKGRVCDKAFGGCGYELPQKSKLARPVVTVEGQLREMTGEIFRKRTVNKTPNAIREWCHLILHRCKKGTKGERTFRQALAAYAMDHYWRWPDLSWPYMPIEPRDFWRKVHDVPRERLTSSPNQLREAQ